MLLNAVLQQPLLIQVSDCFLLGEAGVIIIVMVIILIKVAVIILDEIHWISLIIRCE